MIKKIWDKMTQKERLVAYIASGCFFLAVFDILILQSIMGKVCSMDEQISTEELLIKKNLKILSQKDIISKQQQEYSAYSIEAKSQEQEISSVLKEIEQLAGKSSVTLVEVKPTDLKSEKIIKKYSIALNCEATMEQLANFMYLIEDSTVLFTIDTYNFASKDKEKGILKCNMVISKIVVP